jgi:streptomycin 6-kinase
VDAIPEALARNAVAAWGEAGRRFVQNLPAQLDEAAHTWQLTLGPPYSMSFHWVCRARTADGLVAVLKLGPPGSRDLAGETATLLHYDGQGAVRVLAHAVPAGALLLERAEPGTLARRAPDMVATAAIITVIHRLHRRPPGDVGLPQLLDRNERSFVDHLRRYPGDGPFPNRLVTRALGLLRELCTSAPRSVVLHGDLHHDNVLRASGGRADEPWLAIDPHGVVGDAGAEVGAMLYNPDPDRRDSSLLALVPERIEQLADGLALPVDRVVAWGFVQAVLSEVWTAEVPGTPVCRALDVALALEPRLS